MLTDGRKQLAINLLQRAKQKAQSLAMKRKPMQLSVQHSTHIIKSLVGREFKRPNSNQRTRMRFVLFPVGSLFSVSTLRFDIDAAYKIVNDFLLACWALSMHQGV